MAYNYANFATFYENIVQQLCKDDCYNLVLHKHLGDVFYQVAAKEQFERTWGKKLRFIIRPNMKFLMDLFGIDKADYSVYDIDLLVKKNPDYMDNFFGGEKPDAGEFDRLENTTFQSVFSAVPQVGRPFVCETPINDFGKYNRYWAHRWSTNMGIEEHFKFDTNRLNIPDVSENVFKALEKIGAPITKIVLIAPEAATAAEFPPFFWQALGRKIQAAGYTLVVNSAKYKIDGAYSAFDLNLSLSDVISLGYNCAYVFGLRSGLLDVLAGIGKKMYAFYPAMLQREMFGLNVIFDPETDCNEIIAHNWKIDRFRWNKKKINLQWQINKIRMLYAAAKVLKLFFVFSKDLRKENKKFYRSLKKAAGKDKSFDVEKNIEYPKIRETIRKTFFGIPIYTRIYKTEKPTGSYSIRYKLLGGLIQLTNDNRNRFRFRVLSLAVLKHNPGKYKFLGITIHHYNWQKRWLGELQSQIDSKYDDIYITRHNIGESYVELLQLGNRIKANKSKHPMLLCWDKKYYDFYKMFLPRGCDLKYIPTDQWQIHSVFTKEKLINNDMLELNGQRFFCSTPLIAQNMKKELEAGRDTNFYEWILSNSHIPLAAAPAAPNINPMAAANVADKMKKIGLKEKFVILMPEANSLKPMSNEFWADTIAMLRKNGYDIFANIYLENASFMGCKRCRLSIEELFLLAQKSAGVIGLGSGMSVFLTGANIKMDLFYPHFTGSMGDMFSSTEIIQVYSVFHLPNVSKKLVVEYDMDKTTEDKVLAAITKRYK